MLNLELENCVRNFSVEDYMHWDLRNNEVPILILCVSLYDQCQSVMLMLLG